MFRQIWKMSCLLDSIRTPGSPTKIRPRTEKFLEKIFQIRFYLQPFALVEAHCPFLSAKERRCWLPDQHLWNSRRWFEIAWPGLQISLKIKLRSEAKAKFFSRKIAKRSEAKIFFVCAKRSEANNFSKLRKIAKNCEIAKIFLSFKKSLSSFYYFNNLYKCYIYDVKSLYRLFGHLVENTGKLNEASFTQKNFQKRRLF